MRADLQNKLKVFLQKYWVSLLLLPVVFYYALNRGEFTFIDYINLLIHEGGHGIFRFFGKFIYTAGGTLMQIIIPSLFIYYFLSHKQLKAAQAAVVYLGQNFVNISVYAADAVERKLPLLGGNNVYHDWTYLLSELGILQFDKEVGWFFYALAIISFLVALILPVFKGEYKTIDLNLEL